MRNPDITLALKKWKEKNGLTRKQLSKKIGIPVNSLGAYFCNGLPDNQVDKAKSIIREGIIHKEEDPSKDERRRLFQELVETFGGLAQASRVLGGNRNLMSNWKKNGCLVPEKRINQVQEALSMYSRIRGASSRVVPGTQKKQKPPKGIKIGLDGKLKQYIKKKLLEVEIPVSGIDSFRIYK